MAGSHTVKSESEKIEEETIWNRTGKHSGEMHQAEAGEGFRVELETELVEK